MYPRQHLAVIFAKILQDLGKILSRILLLFLTIKSDLVSFYLLDSVTMYIMHG